MRGMGAFLDVETTGLGRSDEVVEFAIALFAFDVASESAVEIVDHYSGLREPSCAISPEAEAVHGISAALARGKRLDERAVERILGRADFLMAHNASFDRRFVTKLFPETRGMKWHCSMNGIDWYGKGFSSKGLQELLRAHGMEARRAHRALDDVVAAVNLLGRVDEGTGRPYLVELLEGRGVESRGASIGKREVLPKRKRSGLVGRTLKVIGFAAAAFLALGVCGYLFANGA